MKTLVLKDGTTFDVLEDSNISNIRMEVESFAEADEIQKSFTRANLETVTLGGQVFNQVNPVGVSVMRNDGGFICTIHCQDSLQDYVQTQIDNYTERLIEEGVI